jgi:hypothetical protein
LPGKRRGQTARPADEIWSRRHREPRGAQHRPSVGHPTRAVHAQTSRRCPCGKGAPRVIGGFEIQAAVLKHSIRFAPKKQHLLDPKDGTSVPDGPR